MQTPKCRRTLRSLLLQQETHGSLPISWLVDHSYESVLALYKKINYGTGYILNLLRYDTICDAILTYAQKLTYVLIYHVPHGTNN